MLERCLLAIAATFSLNLLVQSASHTAELALPTLAVPANPVPAQIADVPESEVLQAEALQAGMGEIGRLETAAAVTWQID